MAGADGRQWLGVLLVVPGAIALIGALGAVGWVQTQRAAAGYSHTVEPVDDRRCEAGGSGPSDRLEYAELSPVGQSVIDRAVAHPGIPVRTARPVKEFRYGSGIDPGGAQYVRVDGDCYALTARAAGFDDPRLLVLTVILATIACLGAIGFLGIVGDSSSIARAARATEGARNRTNSGKF